MARKIPHLDDYGIVKYNDFTFPPALNATAKLEPVYDDSRRGLMYVKYQIRIEFIICLDDVGELGEPSAEAAEYKPDVNSPSHNSTGPSSGHPLMTKGTIDPQMAFLRRRLMQPGRHLVIRDVGLGYDLNVNDPSQPTDGLNDVAWGPKPINLTWESIASNRAARLVWEVELALPECEDYGSRRKEEVGAWGASAGALPVEVTQVVYNQSWDIDVYGKTTKQYQAILQIRGYVDVNNLTNVLRSSDGYRQYFEPPIKNGYIRNRQYQLNDDKTRLTINITDTQHSSDFPLPPATPDIDVDYSISGGIKGHSVFAGGGWTGWQIWQAKLSGRMVLAKGFDPKYRRIYPYYMFLLIIRSRFTFIEKGDTSPGGGGFETTYDQFGGGNYQVNASVGKGVVSLPVSFEMGESVFGMEFTFSFQWEVLNLAGRAAPFYLRFGCPPNVRMEDQYLPNPTKMWTWNDWKESMYWDRDNNGWRFARALRVPNPPNPSTGMAAPGWRWLYLIQDWDIKRAPFSMSGADNLRFEGDAKMEPCQDTPDFWYKIQEGTFSGVPVREYSEVMATQVDNDRNVISCDSRMEIDSQSNVYSHAPLDNPDDPTTIGMYQDGNTEQGGSVNKALDSGSGRIPEGVGTGAASPGNTKGDSRMSQDPVSFDIKAGDKRDVKLQSMGPPSYTVRCTGEAVTTGLPFNAPRTMRWGEAYAVIQKKKVETARTCRGEVELWKTRWDITYLVSGSPNGFAAPRNPSNLAHNVSQIGTHSSTAFRRDV
tara:strand:- start:1524 stop:3815 length:2292 start_codon:yes stop_codon:yes gene_type:complete